MVRRFVVVGALGFVVQGAVLASLTKLGWPWLAATVVAVESAIAHNFVWHRAWTWRERAARTGGSRWLAEFVRFNAGTAVTSIAGNLGVMALVLGATRVAPFVANIIAVGVMSAANFLLADRWVFHGGDGQRPRRIPPLVTSSLMTALVALGVVPVAFAAPDPGALAAWNKYVGETETRLERERPQAVPRSTAVTADGQSMDVGNGTITHWRGTAFVAGISLDGLLARLQDPGTPPPQEDVVASRVLEKTGDALTVYIRLVRRSLVTVSYDTEHAMRFHRWTPTLATARSVATRIDEVGGDDHGFLWRLNSYWRYEQFADGVLVSLESLTLSRDVPWLLRPIARPIASNIARESMVRTLEALKRYLSVSLG